MSDMANQDQEEQMRDGLRVTAQTSAPRQTVKPPRATIQDNLTPDPKVKDQFPPPPSHHHQFPFKTFPNAMVAPPISSLGTLEYAHNQVSGAGENFTSHNPWGPHFSRHNSQPIRAQEHRTEPAFHNAQSSATLISLADVGSSELSIVDGVGLSPASDAEPTIILQPLLP